MTCKHCGKPLEPRGHKPRLFCNASCRGKAWQHARRTKLLQAARLIREVIQSDE